MLSSHTIEHLEAFLASFLHFFSVDKYCIMNEKTSSVVIGTQINKQVVVSAYLPQRFLLIYRSLGL